MKPPSFPLGASSDRLPTQDEALGMAWWNALSRPERTCVLQAAERALGRTVSVADAWLVWKRTTAHPSCSPTAGADRFAVLLAPPPLALPSAQDNKR